MERTANDRLRSNARLRMFGLARGHDDLRTVDGVEQRTSMNDARMALCIAMGVDLEDIDPSTGHDISRASYESSRASWVRHVAQFGWSDFYDGPVLAEAVERWTARRPQFTAGDDWRAACIEAHRGRACRRETCDVVHDA
jgi:hypothetical protein